MNLPTVLILCALEIAAGAAVYFSINSDRSCCGGKKRGDGACSGCDACGCGCCRAKNPNENDNEKTIGNKKTKSKKFKKKSNSEKK